jgi:hypothetical protein
VGIALGIILGLVIKIYFSPVIETVHAEVEVEPVIAEVVLIEVVYTKEDIIRKIKETFPEDPETAVLIAKCESGLRIEVQSGHTLSYGREQSFGLFQVHSPHWEKTAKRLGYEDYRTDIDDNLALARHIYESAGNSWQPWSCYTKKMI